MRKWVLALLLSIHWVMWDSQYRQGHKTQSLCCGFEGEAPHTQPNVSELSLEFHREEFGTFRRWILPEGRENFRKTRLEPSSVCSLLPEYRCSVTNLLPGSLTTLPVPTAMSSLPGRHDSLEAQSRRNPVYLKLLLAYPLVSPLFYPDKGVHLVYFPTSSASLVGGDPQLLLYLVPLIWLGMLVSTINSLWRLAPQAHQTILILILGFFVCLFFWQREWLTHMLLSTLTMRITSAYLCFLPLSKKLNEYLNSLKKTSWWGRLMWDVPLYVCICGCP